MKTTLVPARESKEPPKHNKNNEVERVSKIKFHLLLISYRFDAKSRLKN